MLTVWSLFFFYVLFLTDYVDLKRDSKRLEHFESLCVVLNELLGDIVIPNSTELLGIYGRVTKI
jgi:hypothetical protein